MDQHTIHEFIDACGDKPATHWRPGDAWISGGTFLHSTPLPALRRFVDLTTLGWPSLTVSDGGLEIAATCRVVELHDFEPPSDWAAGPLLRRCVESFLASFKLWHTQTVGGNICVSLPAGPMITLTAALDATYLLWLADGSERTVAAVDFVTGNNQNILQPGEILRSISISSEALHRRFATRRFTLTKHGRSSVFLVGTLDPASGEFLLTVTAATTHPVHLRFPAVPDAPALRESIADGIPDEWYFDDPNGRPDHRKHLTRAFAEQIRTELSA